jgi:hypothetical protein
MAMVHFLPILSLMSAEIDVTRHRSASKRSKTRSLAWHGETHSYLQTFQRLTTQRAHPNKPIATALEAHNCHRTATRSLDGTSGWR